MVQYGGDWAGAYLLRRGVYMPWELDGLLDPALVEEGLRRLAPLSHIAAELQAGRSLGDFDRVAALETSLYMRNQLLRDADWAGMAHSIEIRVPYVDPFFLSALPSKVDPGEVSVILVIALGLSFLATLYPAWRAAQYDPVEGLRYE